MSDDIFSSEVIVALVALGGALGGAFVTLVASLMTSKTARVQRRWETLWQKKADAYKSILLWVKGSQVLSPTEVWSLAAMLGSDGVVEALDKLDAGLEEFHRLPDKEQVPVNLHRRIEALKKDLVQEIRRDLRTANRLPR
jgi:predicted component of type VI protein secretion system